MVYKSGQMVHHMKDSGKLTEPMEKENLYIKLEIFIKESFLMTQKMDMEYASITMEIDMKVNS